MRRLPAPSDTSIYSFRKVLSDQEKKDYISAVLCLREKPSKADPAFAPGARTRYDDFVAVHINQTLSIHGTVSMLILILILMRIDNRRSVLTCL